MPPVTPKAAPAKKPPVKKEVVPAPERPVLHPAMYSLIFADPEKHSIAEGMAVPPITVAVAKEMLGWEDEKEYTVKAIEAARADPNVKADDVEKAVVKWTDCDFEDMNGVKVRCSKNGQNRIFVRTDALAIMQDILNGHWQLNGENVIISKYGNVVSGQHRLIGFVFACQVWQGSSIEMPNQQEQWQSISPTMPVLESSVFFGGSEEDKVTRTIDQVRPRSYADVRYCQHEAYTKLGKKSRAKVCKMEGFAVRLMWDRTGAKADAYNPSITNSSFLDFLGRHRRLEKCVTHIYEEDADGLISSPSPKVGGETQRRGWGYISPGAAAGLMYLMGCSGTEGKRNSRAQIEKYADADPAPCEEVVLADGKTRAVLSWSKYWKPAQQFWTDLASGNSNLKALTDRMREFYTDGSGDLIPGAGASTEEKVALICLAWQKYRDGLGVKHSDLKLEYVTDKNGNKKLKNPTTLAAGGIDLGWFKDQTTEETEEEENALSASDESNNNYGADDDGSSQSATQEDQEMSEEEYEARKKAATKKGRKQQKEEQANSAKSLKDEAAEILANRAKLKEQGQLPTPAEKMQKIRDAHPGVLLLFKPLTGSHINAWGCDAGPVSKAAKVPVKAALGMNRASFPLDRLEEVVAKLGVPCALVEGDENNPTVTPILLTSEVSTVETPEPQLS